MISPIEKKCCEQCNVTKEAAKFYKSSDAFCLNSDCPCHTNNTDATVERIVETYRDTFGFRDYQRGHKAERVEAANWLRTTLLRFKEEVEGEMMAWLNEEIRMADEQEKTEPEGELKEYLKGKYNAFTDVRAKLLSK